MCSACNVKPFRVTALAGMVGESPGLRRAERAAAQRADRVRRDGRVTIVPATWFGGRAVVVKLADPHARYGIAPERQALRGGGFAWKEAKILHAITGALCAGAELRQPPGNHRRRLGPIADRLINHLLERQPGKIELIGVFDDRGGRNDGRLYQPMGSIADLLELGKNRPIDWILVALPATADDRVLQLVHTLKTLSVPVGLAPESIGLKLPTPVINYIGEGLPVTMLADRPIRKWDAVIKKVEDLVLGGLITLMLLPLLAIVVLLIRLDSPGPILFKQRRHASNNSEFFIYKFRTMRWEPDSAKAAAGVIQQTLRDDPRITKLGNILRKTSIDELPQLFNVLQGDMSLVGPRPHAVNMRTEEQLGHEIVDTYSHRHRVKPGITGWSQVNGSRGATDTVEQLRRRVELDLYYVENWSLWLDIKILVMTGLTVLRGNNAY